MNRLSGKIAVITGGTRGLGLGIAQAFAREGAAVVVASRSQTSVNAAVESIQQAGGKATGLAIDVTDPNQLDQLAKFAISTFGGMDIWVNNAGIAGPYGPTMGLSPKDFTQVIQTNILGVYYGSRTAMEYFLAKKSGKLINVLGHGDKEPVPWQNSYASSKAWVRSFTKALAVENKDSGVGVYAFNPGMVLTDLLTDVEVIEGYEHLLDKFPVVVRMWAKPPEVPANKAVWIASSATDGKTGLWISLLTPWIILQGAISEGIRSLLKMGKPISEIKLRKIPFYKKTKTNVTSLEE